MVVGETSEGGSFVVGPSPALIVWSVILLAAIAAVVFGLVRRRRPSAVGPAGPASVVWIKLTRGVVELALLLVALGICAVLISFVIASDGVTYEAGRVAIADGDVQITVAPPFESASFGTDPGDRTVTRDQTYERWFGSGAKPIGDDLVDAEVLVDDAPFGLWLVTIGTILLTWALVLGFLLALRSLLARAEVGQPFSPHSVRSLRRMALVIGPGVLLVELGRYTAGTLAVEAGGGTEAVGWGIPWPWLVAALVLLALAEVWRYGIRLEKEAEGVV